MPGVWFVSLRDFIMVQRSAAVHLGFEVANARPMRSFTKIHFGNHDIAPLFGERQSLSDRSADSPLRIRRWADSQVVGICSNHHRIVYGSQGS